MRAAWRRRPGTATRAACAWPRNGASRPAWSLTVNVTEDLALEALGYRLAALVGPR